MSEYEAEEAEALKAYLLRSPVLMIHDQPSVDDQRALDLVREIVEDVRIVRHPNHQTDETPLPRLIAGQGTYDSLDDIQNLVEYVRQITQHPQPVAIYG